MTRKMKTTMISGHTSGRTVCSEAPTRGHTRSHSLHQATATQIPHFHSHRAWCAQEWTSATIFDRCYPLKQRRVLLVTR